MDFRVFFHGSPWLSAAFPWKSLDFRRFSAELSRNPLISADFPLISLSITEVRLLYAPKATVFLFPSPVPAPADCLTFLLIGNV